MEAHVELCACGCDKREKIFCKARKIHLSKCARQVTSKESVGLSLLCQVLWVSESMDSSLIEPANTK